jgi:hypothetical protein
VIAVDAVATRAVPLALLLGVLGSGACRESGSGQEAASETPSETTALTAAPAVARVQALDPCMLLTRAEVEQAVGVPVADPVPHPGNAAICHFDLGDGGAVGITTQDLTVDHTPERMMAELAERDIPVTETSGLGDRSFFARHGYGMTGLNTFTKHRCVIITLFLAGATETRQEAVAEELMRKALSRL